MPHGTRTTANAELKLEFACLEIALDPLAHLVSLDPLKFAIAGAGFFAIFGGQGAIVKSVELFSGIFNGN
jgi:hypothetical protein